MARAITGPAYPERFYAAASYVGFAGSPDSSDSNTVVSKFSNEVSLLLYALYKQVKLWIVLLPWILLNFVWFGWMWFDWILLIYLCDWILYDLVAFYLDLILGCCILYVEVNVLMELSNDLDFAN